MHSEFAIWFNFNFSWEREGFRNFRFLTDFSNMIEVADFFYKSGK